MASPFPTIDLPPGGIPLDELPGLVQPVVPPVATPPAASRGTIPLMTEFRPPAPEADPVADLAARLSTPVAPAPPRLQTSGTQTSTRKTVYSKEEEKAHAEGQKSYEQAIVNLAKKRDIDARVAAADEQAANDRVAVRAQFTQERQAAQTAGDQAFKQATADYEADKTRYREALDKEPASFWESRTTGQKILAAVALAMGTIGEAKTGRPNQAVPVIQSAIAADLATQRERIAKIGRKMELSGRDRNDVQTWTQQQLAGINAKESAAFESAADMLAAQKAKLGVPLAELQGDVDVMNLRKQAADADAAFFQGKRTQIDTTVSKSLATPTAVSPEGFAPIYGKGGKVVRDLGKGREEDARAINAVVQTHGNLDRITRDLIKNYDEAGGVTATGAAAEDRKRLQADLATEMGRLLELKQMTKEEIDTAKRQMGGEAFKGETAIKVLTNLRRSNQARVEGTFERYGLPGKESLVRATIDTDAIMKAIQDPTVPANIRAAALQRMQGG